LVFFFFGVGVGVGVGFFLVAEIVLSLITTGISAPKRRKKSLREICDMAHILFFVEPI
jgi:hypothetical protein